MAKAMSATHPFKSAEARERYLAYYDEHLATWPVASEQRVIHTDDGDTFMLVSGPPDAPPVVLLPAGRANALCWEPLVVGLSERFRVYALDAIYDDGRSVNTRPIKTIGDATGWLDRLFDDLGLTHDVTLMGISFGAWLTAEYALHAPERLAKVVWIAPVGVTLPMSGQFLARSMACLIPAESTYRWVSEWIMPDAARKEPEFLDGAIEEMALSEKCFVFRLWPGGGPRKLKDEELAELKMPVLYVVGANERICSDPKVAQERARTLMPDVRTVMIPGAGHDVVWVQTDVVRENVLGFLDA
jgi:pimeloyl-ACP methyl ester carboxylesterase